MPTGPRGIPLLGNYLAYSRNALGFLERTWKEHGDLSRFPLGPFDTWLVIHPDHVQQILQTHHKRYHKGPEYAEIATAVGQGLLTSEDELWRRNRKIAQPAFHRRSLIQHTAFMSTETERMLAGWEAGERDLVPEVSALTLRIVSRALFSTELGEEVEALGEAVTLIIEHINRRLVSPIPMPASWPTPANRRFRSALTRVDDSIRGFITRCRENGDTGDLLSMLLLARDPETGEQLDDQQLRDEVVTLFAAGHETTATSLIWTLSLLSANRDWAEAVAEEARSVLGERIATLEDALPLLDRVIRESLRLYPPAWGIGRQPIIPDTIDGSEIPVGALVFLMPWLTHRHPEFWADPERFDPDRWLPERSEGRHRFAWFPFGGGPRVCIGQGFALAELRIVLGSILARWSVEIAELPRADPSITLRPIGRVPAVLRPRSSGG